MANTVTSISQQWWASSLQQMSRSIDFVFHWFCTLVTACNVMTVSSSITGTVACTVLKKKEKREKKRQFTDKYVRRTDWIFFMIALPVQWAAVFAAGTRQIGPACLWYMILMTVYLQFYGWFKNILASKKNFSLQKRAFGPLPIKQQKLEEITFICAEIECNFTKNLIGVQHVTKKQGMWQFNWAEASDQGCGDQLDLKKNQIVAASGALMAKVKQKGFGWCVYVPEHVRCVCRLCACMCVIQAGQIKKKRLWGRTKQCSHSQLCGDVTFELCYSGRSATSKHNGSMHMFQKLCRGFHKPSLDAVRSHSDHCILTVVYTC